MAQKFRNISVNRNTIAVVAEVRGTKEDVTLLADGEKVHPLVFNPVDRLHYSMIWLGKEQSITKLEAEGTDIAETGTWATPPTPTQPTRANTLVVCPNGRSNNAFTHASPGDLHSAVKMAVAQGDTEIILKDGVYKQQDPDPINPAGQMALFQTANETPFTGVTIVAEHAGKAIISNLLNDSGITTIQVDATDVYRVDGVPNSQSICQLHAVIDGKVERLQEMFAAGTDWTEETLKTSPIGGWFVDSSTNQLFVKLPDGTNPSGKLRIANPILERAWLFSEGNDLWIEGVVFEYWLNRAGASGIHEGSSLIFQHCQQIVIRNCASYYSLAYAVHFANCTDYLVEECDFVDGQSYTTYINMRVGAARFSGTVRNFNSELGTIRNNHWHQCYVVNQFTSSRSFEVFTLCDPATRHIEFHHNTMYQARNHPMHTLGNGGQHAIWCNAFDMCGQPMPNLEQGSPIGPIYWVNNKATDASFFGVFLDDGTGRVIKGNRFGGLRSPRIGQCFFYYNTLRVEWFPSETAAAATIRRINAWQAGSKDHSASRYLNNIFTTIFEEIGTNSPNARAIWFHEGADIDGGAGLHLKNLSQMVWDHNQYFWNKLDDEGNPTDVGAFQFNVSGLLSDGTFAELQAWVDATLSNSRWEPHGAFRNPQFDANSHPTNPITATAIPGVTDNTVLDNPGNTSGATI